MASDINWPLVAVELAGGVALLLIGVSEVSRSLKALSGTRLTSVLRRLSGNRVTGALTGAVATAVVQSSSVTTVLAVSFVSAGIMAVTQAAAVVVGANLGTTVTAQIVALDITEYSLAIVAAGGLLLGLARRDRWRLVGHACVGLGLVFLGLAAMSAAMAPLAEYEPFTSAMAATSNPLLAATIGAVVAATIQSSSATTGIVVAMSAAGLISLPTGIALVLGANIGTCVTAVLAALGRGAAAMQTAVVHVLVNLIGALVWLVGLDALVALVLAVSGGTDPEGPATPRELANAHLIFNLVNTVVFLAALPLLVRVAGRIVGLRRHDQVEGDVVRVSDPLPSVLPGLHQELSSMAEDVRTLLEGSVPAAIEGTADDLASARRMDGEIRRTHEHLVDECARHADEELGEDQRDALEAVLQWGNLLEFISAATAAGILRAGRRRLKHECTFSTQTTVSVARVHDLVLADFDRHVRPLTDPGARPEATPPSTPDWSGPPVEAPLSAAFEDAYAQLSNRLLTGSDARTYGIEVELLAGLENVASIFERFPRQQVTPQ
ncbi:MAG: Na/Pi cotransporter family protein [Actinobacteria bacterium]|nr:Na/Pi cotransporter family protein [Actinomycetota bacterium]